MEGSPQISVIFWNMSGLIIHSLLSEKKHAILDQPQHFLCLGYGQLLTIFFFISAPLPNIFSITSFSREILRFLCTFLYGKYYILWNVYPHSIIYIVHSCRVIRVNLDMDALLIFANCLKSKQCSHQLQTIDVVFGLFI